MKFNCAVRTSYCCTASSSSILLYCCGVGSGNSERCFILSEICITATAYVKPGDNYLGIQLRLVAESSSILLYCGLQEHNIAVVLAVGAAKYFFIVI